MVMLVIWVMVMVVEMQVIGDLAMVMEIIRKWRKGEKDRVGMERKGKMD